MADQLTLDGSVTTTPEMGTVSGFPMLAFPLKEAQALAFMQSSKYLLTADAVQSVNFGGVTNASVLLVKCVGGKVRVRVTSADGAVQSVPVDSLFMLLCESVPITAVDLTRVPATETTVEVFLAQRS